MSMFYSWMKCGNVSMLSLSILYDLCTMFCINADGTRKVSILFLSWFFIAAREKYFPIMARVFIGFFVGCVCKKWLSENGVLICFSWNNWLGNGAKYPKSWNIIRFFAELFLLARTGARPRYLMTLLYRIRSGFIFFILRCNLIASQKFPIPVMIPRYFTNFPSTPDGTVHQNNSTSYPCCSKSVFTSLI